MSLKLPDQIAASTAPGAGPMMAAYAVGQLRNVTVNDGIITYLKRIDATLAPFNGRFIIHGGAKEMLEG